MGTDDLISDLRKAGPKQMRQSVRNDGGLSEEEEISRSRRLGFLDKSIFSQVKKVVLYTLGACVCILMLFLFAAGIYLSLRYMLGLLAENSNEKLGNFLSHILMVILSSISTLFLQGLFQKK